MQPEAAGIDLHWLPLGAGHYVPLAAKVFRLTEKGMG